MELPDMHSEGHLKLIADAKTKGIDLKKYINPKMSLAQANEVYLGLQTNIDVTKYNTEKLT